MLQAADFCISLFIANNVIATKKAPLDEML